MAVSERLKKIFEEQNVPYDIMYHSESFTAQEKAAGLHVPGAQMVKVVMTKADGQLVMLVLSADYSIDFALLREALGTKKVGLADEADFGKFFPDCDLGAMPPFGNLYDIPVWVEEHLAEQESIVFNACTHHEAARIAYSDYDRLVHPKVAEFGRHV